MIKDYMIIPAVVLLCAASCKYTDSKQMNHESEKLSVAYAFLLSKLEQDNLSLIASENDENLDLLNNIIKKNEFDFEVEDYANIEKGPDLCYYSKSTRKAVAIIEVTKTNENKYYVSYYIGPEGGASKEIQIEKRKGKWMVVNDDGRWIVK
ncbi:MAG: hypothetical protein ACYS4W_05195 [Planctomycetota bacterium]|jgi:hypothetical protein